MSQTIPDSSQSSSLEAFEPPPRNLKPTVFWRIADDIPPTLQWPLTVASILIPLVAWWILSRIADIPPSFLPSPEAVVVATRELWVKGFLAEDTVASVLRVSLGFGAAALLSIPLGVCMGTFASIRALCEPFISFLRYMPAPAFIPLLIIYFGLEEAPKIILIFIGTLFFNTLMIMDTVKFVPKDLIETTYTLGGQRWQVLKSVILPYVTPKIIDTFRINFAAAWNLVIVAELIAAEEGLGRRIAFAQRFLRTDEIFACLIILGLLGFILDLLFRWILKTTCSWAFD
ncbi:MAG: ABC transporter permease [Cyanobacteria bacterium P01_F01_bin.150]